MMNLNEIRVNLRGLLNESLNDFETAVINGELEEHVRDMYVLLYWGENGNEFLFNAITRIIDGLQFSNISDEGKVISVNTDHVALTLGELRELNDFLIHLKPVLPGIVPYLESIGFKNITIDGLKEEIKDLVSFLQNMFVENLKEEFIGRRGVLFCGLFSDSFNDEHVGDIAYIAYEMMCALLILLCELKSKERYFNVFVNRLLSTSDESELSRVMDTVQVMPGEIGGLLDLPDV